MESAKHVKRPKRSAGELKRKKQAKVVTLYSHSIMFKVHNVNKVKFSILNSPLFHYINCYEKITLNSSPCYFTNYYMKEKTF